MSVNIRQNRVTYFRNNIVASTPVVNGKCCVLFVLFFIIFCILDTLITINMHIVGKQSHETKAVQNIIIENTTVMMTIEMFKMQIRKKILYETL